jgi:hypothetical protein
MLPMILPAAEDMQQILQRYAALVARLGAEIGEAPMVLPTGRFFPDVFGGDEKSVRRLVRRMQQHAGMSDIPISARLMGGAEQSAGGCGTGGCGTGACATGSDEVQEPRLVDLGDGWRLNVPQAELANPVVLTANVARTLGFILHVETQDKDEAIAQPIDVTAELASVALGFGVLLLEGSYVYQKSCGGPSVARVTRLSCGELATAFMAFVARDRHSLRPALRELGTTQRALVAEAKEWFDSNTHIVNALKNDPQRIALGELVLEEPRPWLARLFGRPSRRLDDSASLEELEAMVTALPAVGRRPESPRSDSKRSELRALVDEAFDAGSAGAE